MLNSETHGLESHRSQPVRAGPHPTGGIWKRRGVNITELLLCLDRGARDALFWYAIKNDPTSNSRRVLVEKYIGKLVLGEVLSLSHHCDEFFCL